MRPNTFGVHFIVRSNREDKQGHVPVYAKVNINSQVLLLSLNHRIPLKSWDSANKQPKNTYKDYHLILNGPNRNYVLLWEV
ncbi:Arm DNA-binding domain-containing protein [Pinibacter soli]|uniref:Arm DNA-binding domain-containing protein n=1 Tax=Pinibacter soli TaxID=3044211 RepID=UPI003CE500AA